jgi:hypothetical protein
MKNSEQIEQELQEIGVNIAGLRSINPYRVPAGYFSTLPEIVLENLRTEAFLAPANSGTYKAPSGYFEGLANNILEKIKAVDAINEVSAELEEVAPLLNKISREEVYKAPADYFANVDFAAKAMRKEGKVVTLRIARKWMQYAAAAVMTGILVTGAFMFTNERPNLNDQNGVSSEFNKVSEADLEKYLDNPEHFVAAPAATSLASEADLATIKTNIQTLSDEELNQYLKENAEPFEAPVSEKE